MRRFKIIALILFIVVAALALVFVNNLGAVNPDSTEKTEFVVSAGTSTTEIADKLEEDGLIKNSFSFYIYLKFIGGKILPGVYEVTPSQSASAIGWMLGSGRYKTARLTIIEGWRVTQIAEYITVEKKLTNVGDFLAKAAPLEGYLFPDTYDVRIDITSDALIKLLRDNFESKVRDLKVTPETVILASIVEREAQSQSDRRPIAGVYSNRIKMGMKLDADPTIQYAKGSWKAITRDDYRNVISPYNTYLNEGLPPGPICSPGLASLQAAADPESHPYYFFFHAQGQTHFSKTLAEHSSKVAQYF